MPLYMKLENPLHLKKSDAREVYDPGMEEYVTMDREYHIRDVLGLPEDASSQEVADVLRAKGYDGVTYRGHTDVGIGSRDIESWFSTNTTLSPSLTPAPSTRPTHRF